MNAFHGNGIDTIAIDTYGLIAHGVAAAGGEAEGAKRLFPWWIRGKTAAGAKKPSLAEGCKTACKRPLAHARSPRDN